MSRKTVLVFVLVAIGVYGLSFLSWKAFPKADDGQIIAAWAQALGAIAAIFGAFYIGNSQIGIAEKARQRSILAIAEALNERAKSIREAFSTPDIQFALVQVYDKTIIDGFVRALNGVPVHEVGGCDGVTALLNLRDQVVFLGAAIETFIEGPWKHTELSKSLRQFGPDERMQQLALVDQGNALLARNVRVHLDQISEKYKLLEQSINA